MKGPLTLPNDPVGLLTSFVKDVLGLRTPPQLRLQTHDISQNKLDTRRKTTPDPRRIV